MNFSEAQDLAAKFAPNDYYIREYRRMEKMYLPRLFTLLSKMEPDRVLEVGPGWGTTAAWLADDQWDVTVIDLMPVGTFMSQELIDYIGAAYITHNIEDSPAPDGVALGAFDTVIMTQVIPHLAWRPDRALRHVKSLLRPGGRFITSVLDRKDYPGLASAYGDDWRAIPEWRTAEMSTESVKCMYTRDTFGELLESTFDDFQISKPRRSTVLFATASSG